MEPDDIVLSDIHIDLTPTIHLIDRSIKDYTVVQTRFTFNDATSNCPSHDEPCSAEVESCVVDEDGDLVMSRRSTSKPCQEVLHIEHCLATRLCDVGLQVWPACMLMCDFIVDNHVLFRNSAVIELGAGVGMASIVARIYSRKVLCTDVGEMVLDICRTNVELNKHLFCGETTCPGTDSSIMKPQNAVKVAQLDWSQPLPSISETSEPSVESWTEEDVKLLSSTNIILAADVVYSEEITDAFFKMVIDIINNCSADEILMFVSLEKRLNFTLDDFDVACPAYEHFCNCLKDVCRNPRLDGVTFRTRQVPHIQQYFDYKRSKYLELWEIRAEKKPTS